MVRTPGVAAPSQPLSISVSRNPGAPGETNAIASRASAHSAVRNIAEPIERRRWLHPQGAALPVRASARTAAVISRNELHSATSTPAANHPLRRAVPTQEAIASPVEAGSAGKAFTIVLGERLADLGREPRRRRRHRQPDERHEREREVERHLRRRAAQRRDRGEAVSRRWRGPCGDSTASSPAGSDTFQWE